MSGPGGAGKRDDGAGGRKPPGTAGALDPGSPALRAPRVPQFEARYVPPVTELNRPTTVLQSRGLDTEEPELPTPAIDAGPSLDAILDGGSSEPATLSMEEIPTTSRDSRTTGAQARGTSRSGRQGPNRPAVGRAAKRLLGTVVDGRYVVEGILGEGGMGVVYLCRRTVIDKLVAMKVLHAELMHDVEVVERFQIEARAASAIGSPHIVEVFDFGALPDGSTYFVMEHLDGTSLTELIDQEAPLPPHQVTQISRQIAEGLGAAHDAGIVHRDLKPDNLILVKFMRQEGFVKILDFGIAKMARAQNRVTRAGSVFGTPQYMSPEQASGTELDHRTDVYALGVIMYEMLAGQVPFDGESPMSILSRHVHAEVVPLHLLEPPPQEIPPGLEAIVQKCLSKNPAQRYATMQALVEDLDRAEHGLSPIALVELAERETNSGGSRVAGPNDLTPLFPEAAGSLASFGSSTGNSPGLDPGGASRGREATSERRLSSARGEPRSSPKAGSLEARARRIEESRAIARSLRPAVGASGLEPQGSEREEPHRVGWAIGTLGILAAAAAIGVVLGNPFGSAPPASGQLPQSSASVVVPLPPLVPSEEHDAAPPPRTPDDVEVQILVFPWSAHLWRAGVDLGKSPVTLRVIRGEPIKIEARAPGMYKRNFVVDGTTARVEVRLAPSGQQEASARPASSNSSAPASGQGSVSAPAQPQVPHEDPSPLPSRDDPAMDMGTDPEPR